MSYPFSKLTDQNIGDTFLDIHDDVFGLCSPLFSRKNHQIISNCMKFCFIELRVLLLPCYKQMFQVILTDVQCISQYKYQTLCSKYFVLLFLYLFSKLYFQDWMRIREWALRSLKQIRAPQVYYRFQLRISRPNFANLFFVPCGATSSVKKCFDSFTRILSKVARQ